VNDWRESRRVHPGGYDDFNALPFAQRPGWENYGALSLKSALIAASTFARQLLSARREIPA